jgi:hypothetical protein
MKNTLNTNQRTFISFSFVIIFLFAFSNSAMATVAYTVTNLNDSGAGSLRAMITAANQNPDYDTINFQAGLTGSINLTSGELLIASTLKLTGPGANLLTVQSSPAAGVANFRVFRIKADSNLTVAIKGLSVSNGGIFNDGFTANRDAFNTLKLDSVFVHHSPSGIISYGKLELTNSTVAFNEYDGVSVNARDSIISNTTVFANKLTGIRLRNIKLSITNCTITQNQPYTGGNKGGIDAFDGIAYLRNTIVAGNTNTMVTVDLGGSNVISRGNNLVGSTVGIYSTFINGVNGDIVGSPENPVDPLFKPFGNYGGTTPTLPVSDTSKAYNAGSNCVVNVGGCLDVPITTDQRGTGYPRKSGNRVDIGAFEY